MREVTRRDRRASDSSHCSGRKAARHQPAETAFNRAMLSARSDLGGGSNCNSFGAHSRN